MTTTRRVTLALLFTVSARATNRSRRMRNPLAPLLRAALLCTAATVSTWAAWTAARILATTSTATRTARQKATQIPADRSNWGTFAILNDLAEQRTAGAHRGVGAASRPDAGR